MNSIAPSQDDKSIGFLKCCTECNTALAPFGLRRPQRAGDGSPLYSAGRCCTAARTAFADAAFAPAVRRVHGHHGCRFQAGPVVKPSSHLPASGVKAPTQNLQGQRPVACCSARRSAVAASVPRHRLQPRNDAGAATEVCGARGSGYRTNYSR